MEKYSKAERAMPLVKDFRGEHCQPQCSASNFEVITIMGYGFKFAQH